MIDPLFSDEDIKEFRKIWFDEYGEWLEHGRARLVADRFLGTLHLIVTLSDRADQRNEQASDPTNEIL